MSGSENEDQRPASRTTIALVDHGYLLLLVLGIALIVISIILSAIGRDANFFIAGGTLLAFFGATAGRLVKLRVTKEGLEADWRTAQVLRQAAAQESAPSPAGGDGESAPDPASVLETTAAVLEATSPDERAARLQELRRSVISPMQRESMAVRWILDLERAAGRIPDRADRGDPGDIVSPPRTIDVRAIRSPGIPLLRLHERSVDAAKTDPHFFIYVVLMPDEKEGSWQLKVLDSTRILELAASARKWYEFSTRGDLFTSAPGIEALHGDLGAEPTQ